MSPVTTARPKLQMIALAKLIEDTSIYPRHAVDSTYVGQLSEALRASAKLPAPLIEATTLRIVDGWHRVRAYRRVLGDEGMLEVEIRDFKSPAEVVRAAVAANIGHGRKLDHQDRVRCALMLSEAGFERAAVAITLNMREEEVPRLVLRRATVSEGTPGAIPGTNQMALKVSAAHLTGGTLTSRQAQAHASMPGTSLTLLARQLTSAIRCGFINAQNERLTACLVELHAVLTDYLATRNV